MGPHLVWAFVVLCGFGLIVWLRRRTLEETALESELLRQDGEIIKLGREVRGLADNTKRLDVLESDLKPIKAKFSAGQFGAIGGPR
jgi:hypothetical protein